MLAVQDVAEVLRREYPQAIDIAYEGVGGALRQAVLDNLSHNGCLLSVGYISEYPHMRPDMDETDQHSSNSSGAPEQSSLDLPPAHELFWQRQVIKRGGQTLYGDVWSGVSDKLRFFELLTGTAWYLPDLQFLEVSYMSGEHEQGGYQDLRSACILSSSRESHAQPRQGD